MKNNELVKEKQATIRAMYHGFVELISEFYETMAFEEFYDDEQEYENMLLRKKVNVLLQKARIDLKKIVYHNLMELMDEIVNTTLDDVLDENKEVEDVDELLKSKANEFYETLAETMSYYIGQN